MKTILLVVPFLVFLLRPDPAQANFYQGKTVTIISGTTAGSAYDTYARLIAQHLGKHVPGNPNFIVQNMPGGGSIVAANFLHGVAKPDGLTIASINPALYFNQLAGRKEVQFDWAKFNWLGSPDWSDHVIYMRTDTPYKTIHDVRTASTPPKCTATATGTTGHYLPKLLEETIGTKFNIILGYPGGPEMDLAVERNEAQCRAFTTTAWFSGEPYQSWRKNGFARLLIQTGRKRDERLPDLPTLYELMDQYKTTGNDRRLADVVLASNIFGRPYVAPPAIPADQFKILREAFAKTMSDRDFLAEAKRRNLEIKPKAGEELEKLAKDIVVQPPEVIDRMKKLLGK
ncbi:MAG: hypothetical protein E6J54_12075 [Deltaproteobacteria bacterium]|nr:MAG: hypothetical protein E6J54_12075 [Deltaproteobacteria bacterium]